MIQKDKSKREPSTDEGRVVTDSRFRQQKDSSKKNPHGPRTGRWSSEEHLLFLYGLKQFGRGKWKKIQTFLPSRSIVQIKSHGQKVCKRLDDGEDIFNPLRDKASVLEMILTKHTKNQSKQALPKEKKAFMRGEALTFVERMRGRAKREKSTMSKEMANTRKIDGCDACPFTDLELKKIEALLEKQVLSEKESPTYHAQLRCPLTGQRVCDCGKWLTLAKVISHGVCFCTCGPHLLCPEHSLNCLSYWEGDFPLDPDDIFLQSQADDK